MVVSYALGHKSEADKDIPVLGEDSPDVITYSKRLVVSLTRQCRNDCPYCAFKRQDNLAVPYSTIKQAKAARTTGAREVLYLAGDRPDRSAEIRSTLDLWGFDSYLDYLYTVCELGFLEGLIPVIELGFLSPQELKRLSEISAMTRIMLDSVDAERFDEIYPKSPGKRLDTRLKSLEWAGKLSFPTITGIMVGIGESKSHRKELLNQIAQVQKQYDTIHEVVIQNFVPLRGTRWESHKPPTRAVMLETVEMAMEILPSGVSVTVPIDQNEGFEDFIKAGVRDIGSVSEGYPIVFPGKPPIKEADIREMVSKMGYRLQQRFPLRLKAIKNGQYSSKLGQVFDAYRYKIKKEEQERLKNQR